MQIKNYCQNNEILFSLPAEEYIFKDCFIELMGIINNLEKIDGIIMPSIFLLPRNKVEYIVNSCKDHSVELHFILESIIIKPNQNRLEEIVELFEINNIINNKINTISNYLKDYYLTQLYQVMYYFNHFYFFLY